MAVHCKAGLGRTGTLIGAFMIYKWGFTASEAIGLMRMMRPGVSLHCSCTRPFIRGVLNLLMYLAQSVVGPQQHFLNTHQHTFVRWSAVDAAAADAGTRSVADPAICGIERPPTPSSDVDVDATNVPPRTPRAVTPCSAVVPGQPRKTPGRSRHAVAAPEAPPDTDGAAMEGVTGTPGAVTSREATPSESTTSVPLRKATRIARPPRARPLSAINDNRIIDRLGLDVTAPSDGTPSSVPRSKGARNLGTLFEALAPDSTTPPTTRSHSSSSSQQLPSAERYNLRRDAPSRSNSGNALNHLSQPLAAPASTIARPPNAHSATSPSRLPQRIPVKRLRIAKSNGHMVQINDPADDAGSQLGLRTGRTHAPVHPMPTTTRLTRLVRRRRSSMGATDIAGV